MYYKNNLNKVTSLAFSIWLLLGGLLLTNSCSDAPSLDSGIDKVVVDNENPIINSSNASLTTIIQALEKWGTWEEFNLTKMSENNGPIQASKHLNTLLKNAGKEGKIQMDFLEDMFAEKPLTGVLRTAVETAIAGLPRKNLPNIKKRNYKKDGVIIDFIIKAIEVSYEARQLVIKGEYNAEVVENLKRKLEILPLLEKWKKHYEINPGNNKELGLMSIGDSPKKIEGVLKRAIEKSIEIMKQGLDDLLTNSCSDAPSLDSGIDTVVVDNENPIINSSNASLTATIPALEKWGTWKTLSRISSEDEISKQLNTLLKPDVVAVKSNNITKESIEKNILSHLTGTLKTAATEAMKSYTPREGFKNRIKNIPSSGLSISKKNAVVIRFLIEAIKVNNEAKNLVNNKKYNQEEARKLKKAITISLQSHNYYRIGNNENEPLTLQNLGSKDSITNKGKGLEKAIKIMQQGLDDLLQK